MSKSRRKFFNSIGATALGAIALNFLPVKYLKSGKTESTSKINVKIHPLAVNRKMKGDS